MSTHRALLLAALCSLILTAAPRAHGQPAPVANAKKASTPAVTVEAGNLFLHPATGAPTQLTRLGLDERPVLSPDGQRVAFRRRTPGRTLESATDTVEAGELWIIDATGQNARKLLTEHASDQSGNVERTLIGLSQLQFSPDGKVLYFWSEAAVVTGTIHALTLATGQERFVCPGNRFHVLSTGRHQGMLSVNQHRYFVLGGSFDWYWLISPDGKELGVIGEQEQLPGLLE